MSPIRKEIIGLLVFMMIVLAINPKIVTQMDQTILGRVVLVAIMICLAASNATIGILCVFIVIVLLNMFGDVTKIEGLTNNKASGWTASNVSNVSKKIENDRTKPQDKFGPSTEPLKLLETMVKSKESNSLPISKSTSSDVKASSSDIFTTHASKY